MVKILTKEIKSFFVKYALIPITATMFALWYFSLAMDELRKRIPLLDRIFAFFTGANRTVQQALPESPAASDSVTVPPKEPTKPKEPEQKKPVAEQKPTPAVEPTKPAPEQKPIRPPVVEPVAKPVVPKPEPPKVPKEVKPPAPVIKPVEPSKVPEPAKPAPTLPVVDVPKPEPAKEPTPAPVEIPKPAPTPAPAPARLVKEKKELPTPKPAAEPITPVLPSNNEDSFIMVEQQKPSVPAAANKTPATAPQKPKVDLKNSTMDFLQGESGRGPAVVPPSTTTTPNTTSAER